jgi:hypothetical protein
MPLNVFNLDGYAVDGFRHNHSTWMVMPLNMFGQTFSLDVYAVQYVRHKHLTYAVECFQLGWLCR